MKKVASMYMDEIRDYALGLDEKVEECFPFGPETFVYKIAGKIFMLMSFDDTFLQINVKCNPEKAIELRERYVSVTPGYHMNKKHWNTLIIDGSIPSNIICQSIQGSFLLVAPKPKAK